MSPKQSTPLTAKYPCCHLVRFDKSSRSSLPLARRGRPHLPSRARHSLCTNCLKIKRKQENDILQQRTLDLPTGNHSKSIFDTITDLTRTSDEDTKHQMVIKDIPHEIEFSLINKNEQIHLNNSDYESSEMLVWKINTSDNPNQTNTIDVSYDTGSLSNQEKKILLQEAVEKLQIVLSHRSTTASIPASDLDQIEFTYRALQTTVDILSSSLHLL